jgi:hypothetical protein
MTADPAGSRDTIRPLQPDSSPYLTVVATARNDNHGGDLLHRMQVFVSGLAAQCARFGVPAELILVEWNPPPDRERLRDALEWPPPDSPLQVRIVEVPPEVHSRFDHAHRLPLFQMIAKNVGIRRARGRFVLATNVDVLLSDALMHTIAQRRLHGGHLYRADRHDVDAPLDPRDAVESQLGACAARVIRVCAREGTTDLRTGEYFPIYGPMSHWPGPLGRWGRLIRLGVPFVFRRSLALGRHAVVKLVRDVVRLAVRAAAFVTRRVAVLAYQLQLALLVVGFVGRYAAQDGLAAAPRRALSLVATRRGRGELRALVAAALAAYSHEGLRRRAPRRRELRALLRAAAADWSAFTAAIRSIRAEMGARKQLVERLWEEEKARVFLHTNACGDFTLMSREDWFRVRGYAELEIFSMHLDSLLLYEAHYSGIAHTVLDGPVYHLEHGGGFKPDTAGLKQLNDRLDRDAIPQVTYQQFLDWVIQMFRQRRPIAFNEPDWGLAAVELRDTIATGARDREIAAAERMV